MSVSRLAWRYTFHYRTCLAYRMNHLAICRFRLKRLWSAVWRWSLLPCVHILLAGLSLSKKTKLLYYFTLVLTSFNAGLNHHIAFINHMNQIHSARIDSVIQTVCSLITLFITLCNFSFFYNDLSHFKPRYLNDDTP